MPIYFLWLAVLESSPEAVTNAATNNTGFHPARVATLAQEKELSPQWIYRMVLSWLLEDLFSFLNK